MIYLRINEYNYLVISYKYRFTLLQTHHYYFNTVLPTHHLCLRERVPLAGTPSESSRTHTCFISANIYDATVMSSISVFLFFAGHVQLCFLYINVHLLIFAIPYVSKTYGISHA